MKNKILFYFILFFFSASSVNSQITISPEIGISYLPFKLHPLSPWGLNNKINSNEVNLLLGVSAQMPLHKKWNTKLRISYANRNNIEWVEYGDFGGGFDYEWKHQDLNIDLNFQYKLAKRISIGIGPSLIRSFMERSRTNLEDGEISLLKTNKFYFGLNSIISLEMKKITINLLYLRTNRAKGYRFPIGDNRIDLTIGYRFGKR